MASIDFSLPELSHLSPSLLSFLESNFRARGDLLNASHHVAELQTQCSDLDQRLADLSRTLQSSVVSYASHSDRIGGLLDGVGLRLGEIRASSLGSGSSTDGGEGEGLGREKQILGEELPALAKEVARVETVRAYAAYKSICEIRTSAETLKKNANDITTSPRFVPKRPYGPRLDFAKETRMFAINALKITEDILVSVTKSRPQWAHLVSAVDHRVDRALAILRPQAIADYRSLLSSLGWPPPLTNLNSANVNAGKSSEVLNPFFTMQGDVRKRYCGNFLALCSLQQLQSRRKSRQLEGHNLKVALSQPLWAIEELVNPISLASQSHFAKWVDKPEFIFALIYKVTRDFVDSVDELLQPLVDEARLVGYSCREEWISSMVTSISTYLAKEIFPIYVGQLGVDNATGVPSQARTSWLHLVDLMIRFDKQVQSLLTQSGVLLSVKEDENAQKMSCLSVFCDRPDWLELWAELELGDALDKLRPQMENERSWKAKVHGVPLVSWSDDYKSPTVTSIVLRYLLALIERCRQLPSISLRARFIRLTAAPVIRAFLDCLLCRCQEAEGLTALADDGALMKVANSINAARFCESVLREWCEDVFFLEMDLDEGDEAKMEEEKNISGIDTVKGPKHGILDQEVRKLEEFRMEWVKKLSTVILRGFDAQCRDYMKNRKQWQEKGNERMMASKSFVGALDILQGKTSKVGECLNEIDFVSVWRSLAEGVDRMVFGGVLMTNAKFSDSGVERFGGDLNVLFGVFAAWCLRPEGFFPKLTEGLKLLRMGEDQLKEFVDGGKDGWLKKNGIRHLSVPEAEKIAKSRVFHY
ncbi:hypothetical protein Sjap_015734 [Stephania japonica]|uniref:RINT1-like protein MAG2 n=1 Tax=Stephania japonica TaxID=461633 RepID=A0AAP0IJZ4_9MAGN